MLTTAATGTDSGVHRMSLRDWITGDIDTATIIATGIESGGHRMSYLEQLKNECGTPDLPEACPIVTEGPVPRGCRFHPKMFVRLMKAGTLPINGACPMRRVCGVDQSKGDNLN